MKNCLILILSFVLVNCGNQNGDSNDTDFNYVRKKIIKLYSDSDASKIDSLQATYNAKMKLMKAITLDSNEIKSLNKVEASLYGLLLLENFSKSTNSMTKLWRARDSFDLKIKNEIINDPILFIELSKFLPKDTAEWSKISFTKNSDFVRILITEYGIDSTILVTSEYQFE